MENNLEQDEYGLYIHALNYTRIRKEIDADKTHNETPDGPAILWTVIIFVVIVLLTVLIITNIIK